MRGEWVGCEGKTPHGVETGHGCPAHNHRLKHRLLDFASFKICYPVEVECFPDLIKSFIIEKTIPYVPDSPPSLGNPVDPPHRGTFNAANDGFRPLRRIAGDIESRFVEVVGETKEHARQLVRPELQGREFSWRCDRSQPGYVMVVTIAFPSNI